MENKTTLSVLVVEDSEDLAELAAMALGNRGHSIFKALSGTLGLQTLRREKIDVILLDLTLPDMEPEEFLQQLRAQPDKSSVSLILVSGRDDIHEWADRYGHIPCLKKPYDFESLISAVESPVT